MSQMTLHKLNSKRVDGGDIWLLVHSLEQYHEPRRHRSIDLKSSYKSKIQNKESQIFLNTCWKRVDGQVFGVAMALMSLKLLPSRPSSSWHMSKLSNSLGVKNTIDQCLYSSDLWVCTLYLLLILCIFDYTRSPYLIINKWW